MIGDEDAVQVALEAAELGMAAGEMPIGAAVFVGDELVATAHTQERAQRRRIVHADLLAMESADALLGFTRPSAPITLAVNLEPCMMCLGAAITLGVSNVVYALESPNDGGVELLKQWKPQWSFHTSRRRAVSVEGFCARAPDANSRDMRLVMGP